MTLASLLSILGLITLPSSEATRLLYLCFTEPKIGLSKPYIWCTLAGERIEIFGWHNFYLEMGRPDESKDESLMVVVSRITSSFCWAVDFWIII